ncbi:ABC transporter substrate-binding protein [Pseudobacteriovorax antillogorgiicola]|uniref:Peptide/nickel transport system substrate-binding protein n=1 Tax=Pseudobacteriovorax antillogorgiicola TaxID=1513793 RepID=A0A1Y6B6H6_9BACT|nr:ABC transporter substrate-binding protein [Pseudobacteriovorax antillogorgiicola]TCS59504.1 peptide/nickel transport system substrate-binding protein [Pseudobacteriovorax antillogorgiicola]SME87896.1 peptide/nickel transport system substrate-binding protein [Pseudobacteriovorax antillogorgiicola]
MKLTTVTLITFLSALAPSFGNLQASSINNSNSIYLGLESQVRSFDPRNNVDANSQYLESLVHCSLIDFDPGGTTMPSLAIDTPSWSKDGLTMKVKIKDAVKFSDGTTVTAKDVAATYQSLISENLARSGAFRGVKSVSAEGPYTVAFQLNEPDATFESNLVVGILPEKFVKSKKTADKDTPGCGAYVIAEQQIGELTLKRNSQYSLGPKAKMEHILIKVVKSEKTRFAKLRTGELDIVQNTINRDLVKKVEREYPQLTVLRRPALKTTYLGFNMRDSITGNPKVRQAIAKAVERQPIIQHILGGLATPAQTMLPPDSPFYFDGLSKSTLDLAGANKLLDKAGFKKKGRYRFTLSYKTTTNATRINIARAIASQLKKIGIKVKVEPMEWGRFKQDVEKGRVQLWGLTWVGFKDPDIYRYAFASDSTPPNGGNRGWYSNPTLDKLLAEGRQTFNPEERRATYHKVQKILDEDKPYIFLWHEENFAIVNKKVKGFEIYADGRFNALTKASKQ